ncbi:N6-L-threonylcarbamoyladenine synthase [Acetitomaculum ruminis DSM 5522]|uniref:tRNA N6-adenosine threonylcarbamoyltransferase n=1 Tax=Acetitomaculum ruminis DSM 5522 TaxID=1120918 RepID=A0A1I0Z710_9FIRM|nr:tRNA (adenosine(37)-N6)-threonylcarbamoyltransferase complex transferase subunit TsaD [Acetitomaculum ruminis]SFB21415.1 N6-L-threonylcarbamoyladenine synthase [Acetitomaculum ruminis DSM 5522]
MSEKDIYILAIESSCDETAAAVVKNGRDVISSIISSQIDIHKLYGGVVPEIASRKHIERVNQVIKEAMKEANMEFEDLDAIGVTYGPGLVGALLVGVSVAKAIAFAAKKPLVGVHHIEGHISAAYIENKELEPPFISLVVSGGHTNIVKVLDYGKYEILASTRDDACGEAFDKVARVIDLGYPGGPKIDALAKVGNPYAIDFPKASVKDSPMDFSFSGLKTAVINYVNTCKMKHKTFVDADLAASFQKSVVDVLTEKTLKALKDHDMKVLSMAGGVASNMGLRQSITNMCEENDIKLYIPSPILCTDNAAMIGAAAYYDFINGKRDGWDLNAVPNLSF